jgi:hypothetical protein
MSKETKLQEKSKRVKRKRLEQVGPLFVDDQYKRAGFVRRFVNNTPGAIKRAEKLGYTVVQEDMQVGDSTVSNTKPLDSAVSVVVDKKTGQKAYLMEIPREEWEEIQAEKAEMDRFQEAGLADTGIETQYGAITKGKD